MRRPGGALAVAALALAPGACAESAGASGDQDRGPLDATLGFADRVNWPGLDRASGRVIPFLNSFADDRPSGYWFLGFGARNTADAYWFCREGDTACPLDAHRRLNWGSLVGHPIFTTRPGEPDASAFWRTWRVSVPATFVADSVKTLESLERLAQAGVIRSEPLALDFGKVFGESVGRQEVVLHCPLVLQGTELDRNGGPMPDGSGPMLHLERRSGWYRGFRVDFVDFSPSDGAFPPAADSDDRPRMRFANIYVLWRRCDSEPRSWICDLPGYGYRDRRPVSERGLGQDITGNGSTYDTNNVLGAGPCQLRRPTERPYSPLWAPQATLINPPFDPALIDTTRDPTRSDIASADTLFDEASRGRLATPVPMREDETGNPVPGNDGQVFFNCPSPVSAAFVPFPCGGAP